MSSTKLCGACSALRIKETLQELADALMTTSSADSESQEESQLQTWHTELAAPNKSSPSCSLCKLVLQGLRADRRQLVEDARLSGDWFEPPKDLEDDILIIPWYSTIGLEIVAWPLSAFERKNTRSSHGSGEETMRLHAIVRITAGGQLRTMGDGYEKIRAELRISCKDGQTAGGFEIDRTVERDPLSPTVFDQQIFWLSACSNNHHKCRMGFNSSVLPTRVLDVEGSETGLVYLREAHDEPDRLSAPYAALSHCWGLSQPFTTTNETLRSRKEGIRVEDMPQTFQDAVAITRGLGLQYIWVDSLCIIQDSLFDWTMESEKMTTIYRSAHVVVSASNASADSEGFLHTRQTETISLGQNDVTLLPPQPQRLGNTLDPVKSEPLSTRAWCLQERTLPRRTLLVGKQQMFWECAEMVASEDGDCIAWDGDRFRQIGKTAAIELSIATIRGRSPGETTDINYFDWYETVKEYARRHITKESDRLPALGGFARALYGSTNDEYFAGIWQKGLIEGLLWCRADREPPLTKPADYRAPSWSWASVNGAIDFTVYNFYERCRWKAVMANFELLAAYVDSYFAPRGEDEFGGIKNGWIKLRAPLLPVISVEDWKKISYSAPPFVMDPFRSTACDKVLRTKITHNGGKTETIYLDGGFDSEDYKVSQGTLFVLLLARLPDPPSAKDIYMDVRFGLILELVVRGDYQNLSFRRVGIVDGVVKTEKPTLQSRLSGKTHLENYLWKQQGTEDDEDNPNLQGPDPFEEIERTEVRII